MENLIVESRNKFIAKTGVVFLRILYRNAQEFFEIENYLLKNNVKKIIKQLDDEFLKQGTSITWKDKLLYDPEYIDFSALVFSKNQLSCFDNNFKKNNEKSKIISEEFKDYYKIIKGKLADYVHLIVPISSFTFNKKPLPLLFLNVLIKDTNKNNLNFKDIVIKFHLYFKDYTEKYFIEKIYNQTLKTAIISILIDSYAHNISAHSLAALKWWIELRHKMLDKRFKIPQNGLVLNCINPCLYSIDKNKTKKTTEKYYEALGLTDSTYNADYYSLYDFLQFAENDVVKDLFKYTSEVIPKEGEKFKFHPRFPVPIDYALYPFFRFLRDKGAFWSGVTRDMAFGGESKTWYKILWEDFANNPLYLGTIAKSEGITKINIYLKVKTKDKNGKNELLEGRFVTIDMSVIDYETAIAESTTLCTSIEDFDPDNKSIKVNQEHLKKLEKEIKDYNNNLKDDKKKVIPFVESKNYSKYAFIKLGERFSKFREILDNEENFRVFLPGGIVGEHALFTIFENTIRNIKHYKDPNTLKYIQENGIDFWISIEEDKLSISKRDSNKKPELFKVGVWLGHETKLITKEETKNHDGKLKEHAEYLLFTITDNTLKPILDESTGAPRMGGNSQDKACAAMLFNNKFSSVEDKEKPRDRQYFPWIEFKTLEVGEKNEAGIKLEWKENQKVISEKSRNKYINNIKKNGKGYLKKYFYVWRGEDQFTVNKESDFEFENVARFRFVIVNTKDSEMGKTLISRARKDGIIRILHNVKLKNIKNAKYNSRKPNYNLLENLYVLWLKEWFSSSNVFIKFKKQNSLSTIYFQYPKNFGYKSDAKESQSLSIIKSNESIIESNEIIEIRLSHGGNDEESACNIRSHGAFWSKFFSDVDEKDPNYLKLNKFNKPYVFSKKNNPLLLELLETLASKIIIFDNRIHNRFNSYSKKKLRVFRKSLNLYVFEESLGIHKYLHQLIDKNVAIKKSHTFLIVHLSFIESIGYKENNLHQFINDHIKKYIKKDNFILVITSGRGRDSWRESLKYIFDLKQKVIFKPVETLLNAVESGISYNDNFDVKYNLIKVIFGS